MSFNRVVLILPPRSTRGLYEKLYPLEEHLGLQYLSSKLIENGINVELLYCEAEHDTFDESLNRLLSIQAEIFCFTTTQASFYGAAKLAKELKRHKGQCIAIAGGPHATLSSSKISSLWNVFDYIVVGDGGDFLLSYSKSKISNMKNKLKRPVIVHGGKFSFSNYNKPYRGNHYLFSCSSVMSSHGCLSNCSFCSIRRYEALTAGKMGHWQARNANDVLDEIEECLLLFDSRIVKFRDDGIEGHKNSSHFYNLCKRVVQRGISADFFAHLRADRIINKKIDLIAQAGFRHLMIGLESADERILRNIFNKGCDVNTYREIIPILRYNGIDPICGMIIFHPFADRTSILNDMNFVYENGLWQTNLSSRLTVYIGTPIIKILSKHGYLRSRNSGIFEFGYLLNSYLAKLFLVATNVVKASTMWLSELVTNKLILSIGDLNHLRKKMWKLNCELLIGIAELQDDEFSSKVALCSKYFKRLYDILNKDIVTEKRIMDATTKLWQNAQSWCVYALSMPVAVEIMGDFVYADGVTIETPWQRGIGLMEYLDSGTIVSRIGQPHCYDAAN